MKKKSLIITLMIFCLALGLDRDPFSLEAQSKFPNIYKVSCLAKIEGCPCYLSSNKIKEKTKKIPKKNTKLRNLFHAESVIAKNKTINGLRQISVRFNKKPNNKLCWYPNKKLIAMKYAKVNPKLNINSLKRKSHKLISLKKLVASKYLKSKKKINLGLFWATYYHLALEDFYPSKSGKNIAIRGRGKKILGYASPEFLDQVRWQGSGITKTGQHLHIVSTKKPLRFENYPNNIWAWGAGESYKVAPYRTIALHFPALCKLLGRRTCSKSSVIGTLLYIPKVVGIKMREGEKHDGYFCANDTGSPYYIRSDRIDIFVGIHGGGNPYLPYRRQTNSLIEGGIQNIVPSDWRLWKGPKLDGDRIWCPTAKLPRTPWNPKPGDCTHDYHVVARAKAMRIFAMKNSKGDIVKCRKF